MNTSLSLLALACLIGEAPGCASSTHPRPEVLVARSGAPRDWHAGSDYSPDIGILATRSDDLEVALAGQSEGALERRNGDDSLQRVKRSQKGSSEQTKLEEMSIVTSSHKEASGREATSKPKKKEHPQNPHYNSKEVSEIVRKSKLKKQQEKDLKRYRTDPHSYDLVEGNEHRIVLLAGMIDWSPLKAPQTKAKSKKKLAKMRQPQTIILRGLGSCLGVVAFTTEAAVAGHFAEEVELPGPPHLDNMRDKSAAEMEQDAMRMVAAIQAHRVPHDAVHAHIFSSSVMACRNTAALFRRTMEAHIHPRPSFEMRTYEGKDTMKKTRWNVVVHPRTKAVEMKSTWFRDIDHVAIYPEVYEGQQLMLHDAPIKMTDHR